jgi:hypothetical protein
MLTALLSLAAGVAALPDSISARSKEPPAVTQEYDLKAVFLFNFAQFVEWPANAFAEAKAPVIIGVLGDDPFGKSLDDVVAGEIVRNRPLTVRRYRSVEEIDRCHILFISPSESNRLDRIMAALAHRSILTVGDTKDFTSQAGVIGFELWQRRLRLRINVAAAKAAGLTISSKLLRQAVVVGAARGRP